MQEIHNAGQAGYRLVKIVNGVRTEGYVQTKGEIKAWFKYF